MWGPPCVLWCSCVLEDCCCSCLVAISRPTRLDCSPFGSSVHGISQQEYWSGLLFPPPGNLPDPGIKPMSSALAGRFLPLSHLGSLFYSIGSCTSGLYTLDVNSTIGCDDPKCLPISLDVSWDATSSPVERTSLKCDCIIRHDF